MSDTNKVTTQVLNYFFDLRIFAFRNNTTGIFDSRKNIHRPAAKVGVSDIIAILPPYGQFLGVEIKTGTDQLSMEQQGFIENVSKMGGHTMVVKDFADFESKFKKLIKHIKEYGR
jgi:hypothetical protein